MVKKLFSLLWLLVLIIHIPVKAGQLETVPVGDKSYSWIYQYIDKLYVRGYLKELHVGTKPYYRGEIASSLLNLKTQIEAKIVNLSSFEKHLYSELENEFESEMKNLGNKRRFRWGLDFLESSNLNSDSKSVFHESFLPHLQADIGDNFSLLCRYSLDEGLAKDTTYTGKVWKGFAGDAAQAYLSFKLPYFYFLIGRENLSWGQSQLPPLILSPNSPPIDMLKLQGKWGFFKLSSFFAQLDPVELTDSNEIISYRRYLSAHRFSFKLKEYLELGFSETVVYGGKNRWFELYYLNPLLWFHAAQLNENEDDNTLWGLDFNFSPLRRLLLYGELLIDDFQIEKKSASDQEPNELAYTIGFKAADFFGVYGSEANLEYSRINNWTYNQKNPWNKYIYKNKIIGSLLGPDSDKLFLSMSGYLRRGLEAKISFEQTRKGEGKIYSPWDEPWLTIQDYKENFPSGIVEKTEKFKLSVDYYYKNIFRTSLSGDFTRIYNHGNSSGNNTKTYGFSLFLNYHFSRK